MLVFWGEGKPEYPEKTSRSRVENQQTQPTYDAEPGPHWWEASALATALSLYPFLFLLSRMLNEVEAFGLVGYVRAH